MCGLGKTSFHTRQWSSESVEFIRYHAVAKVRVLVEITIGADQHFIHLRREALQYMRHERFAAEEQQTFVGSAHSIALATRED